MALFTAPTGHLKTVTRTVCFAEALLRIVQSRDPDPSGKRKGPLV
jgi:hypothetical protein